MKNFIFKSKDKSSDLYKIQISLELILREQRHQRSDLAHITRQISNITNVPIHEDLEHIPEEELDG